MHPLVMTSLFFYTLWAGYLGWQWRRVRTVQEEINELKKQVNPTPAAAGAEEASQAPPPRSPVELKIQELTEVLNSLPYPHFIQFYKIGIRYYLPLMRR